MTNKRKNQRARRAQSANALRSKKMQESMLITRYFNPKFAQLDTLTLLILSDIQHAWRERCLAKAYNDLRKCRMKLEEIEAE